MNVYIVLENRLGCELTRYPVQEHMSIKETIVLLAKDCEICPGDVIRIVDID